MAADDDELLTLDQTKRKLKCGRTKIFALAKEHRLELVKFGGRTLVTSRSVDKLIQELIRNSRAAS